ncbi:MAG: hypothetical protein ACXVFC_01000 [Gaiellaceae bacterium]
MKRALLLAAAGIAAIAVVLPATAEAASFTGVVIAKKQARHAVVTASKDGVVRTTRVRGALGRYRIGRHVFVRGAVLPDGTYAASKIRLLGPNAKGVRLHGSVVWATAKQLVVSAGASVFSLALRGGTSAPSAGSGLQPGDDLDLSADVKSGALQTSTDRLHKTGHSDELVLEGIYLSTADDGTIELAVVHRGRVFVNVPGDVFVPPFQAGDVIALVVKVENDGSFTLVKADDESGSGDGDGDHIGNGQFTVVGRLTALGDGNVSVTVGDGDSHKTATCAVPEGYDLSGYEVGLRVKMTCKYNSGHPVLVSLEKKDAGSEYLYAIGDITDLSDGSITVQGDGDPVTCAVPDGFDLSDYAEGDSVVIKCDKENDVWTLKGIEHRTQPPPPPSYLKVTGPITALDGENITVHGETGLSTCFVPDGADLSAFSVGTTVQMICLHTDDGMRLKRLQSDSAVWEDGGSPPPPPPPPPPSYVQLTGPITALADGDITVQGEHEPVTCAVPDGADLSGFHVSDYVSMKCVVTDGGLRLKRLQSDSAFWEAT